MSRDLIVVDTETTGLNPEEHWVLEVAAINVRTREELHFVPALPVGALDDADGKAMAINKYFERGVYAHRRDVADSVSSWNQLWDWLSGNTLAGSNPSFDAAMLNRSAQWCLKSDHRCPGEFAPSPWHHRLADLAAYAGGALGILPTKLPGLQDVAARLKVDLGVAHSALDDARATAECFRKLTDGEFKAVGA